MCFSPITQENSQAFIDNYTKWQGRFYKMQFIPVIGMVGSVGVLCLDFKTLIANKLYAENLELQQQIAKASYSRTNEIEKESSPTTLTNRLRYTFWEHENKSSFSIRVLSVVSLLTATCLPMIVLVLAVIVAVIALYIFIHLP